MSVQVPARCVTVRLSPTLYAAASAIAKKRSVSLNGLVQESLAREIRIAEEQQRYDEYALLGQDRKECDVDYAFAAQAEVRIKR